MLSIAFLTVLGWGAVFAIYDAVSDDDDPNNDTDAPDAPPDRGNDDLVLGTDAPDLLTAEEGQTVRGGVGNDTINAEGHATIYGGAGSDVLTSDRGTIVELFGGNGDDTVDGSRSDFAHNFGGAGDDQIILGNGSNTDAGNGDDIVQPASFVGGIGDGNNAIVDAGAGNDFAQVGVNSRVDGGEGDDTLRAEADSTLDGGEGDDDLFVTHLSTLIGGEGDDNIRILESDGIADGGSGNDTIRIGAGSYASGGAGDDLIRLDSMHEGAFGQSTTIEGGNGDDLIEAHVRGHTPDQGSDILEISGGEGQDKIVLHIDQLESSQSEPVLLATLTDFDPEYDEDMLLVEFEEDNPPLGIELISDEDIPKVDIVIDFQNGDQAIVQVLNTSAISTDAISFFSQPLANSDLGRSMFPAEFETGTPGDDTMAAGEWGFIRALGGDDVALEIGDNTFLDLGDGNDTASIISSNSYIIGGAGDDVLNASEASGPVKLFGDEGDDEFVADASSRIDPGAYGEGTDSITLNLTNDSLRLIEDSKQSGRVILNDPADELTLNIADDVDGNIHMYKFTEQSGGGATSGETQYFWLIRTDETVTELTNGQLLGFDDTVPFDVLMTIDLGYEHTDNEDPARSWDNLNENPNLTIVGTLTSQGDIRI